jgi:dihydroflavonol-4-reductase
VTPRRPGRRRGLTVEIRERCSRKWAYGLGMAPTTSSPVCVTGASGFIASQLVALLLERGYRVRGTVRSTKRKDALERILALPDAGERLELVEADLLDPPSLERAVAGCELVMHTASPYIMKYRDPQKELVDPAVKGTRDTLLACKAAGTVRRVVVTSSVAAITDEPEDRVLDEEDWNTRSSLERNAYYFSKAQAEKAAWRFVEEERPGFDLVVINPFMVIGPSLVPSLNESNKVIVDMLTGKYPGIVSLAWGFVDVRDVARAHLAAAERKEAHGRYLCANVTLSMRELAERLRRLAPGYRVPRMSLEGGIGSFLTRATTLFYPRGVRDFVRSHLGRVPRFDNGKIARELGIEFTDIDVTLRDAVEDLARWGHIPAPRQAAAA